MSASNIFLFFPLSISSLKVILRAYFRCAFPFFSYTGRYLTLLRPNCCIMVMASKYWRITLTLSPNIRECYSRLLPHRNDLINAFYPAMWCCDFVVNEICSSTGSEAIPIPLVKGEYWCLSKVDELLIGHNYFSYALNPPQISSEIGCVKNLSRIAPKRPIKVLLSA